MRQFRSAVVVAAMFVAASSARGQAPAQTPPEISVTGTGEAIAIPDRATIYIGVQSRAPTAAAASAANARRQRAVIDTLLAIGFTSSQLSTANYDVSPQMGGTASAGNAPTVVAYVVSNTVRVDVRRLDDISRAIDASLAKGANEISSLEFYSSQADSARRAALASAVANARADAEALARAAGGQLGGLLELSSSSGEPIRFNRLASAAPMAAPTPIEPGQQTISATVSARWAFVPRQH